MKKAPAIILIAMLNIPVFAQNGFQMDSVVCYEWDTLTNSWLSPSKGILIYDADGNKISHIYQSIYGAAWRSYAQFQYTYDANGNQTKELYQIVVATNWVNHRQYIYTYDTNGRQTNALYQSWNGTNWVNSYQYISTNDANGNRTSLLVQNWNGTAWVNNSQSTFIYDATGNQTSYLKQDWNGTAWTNYEQETFTYDANGNQLSQFFQTWDGTAWVNSYQTISTYDTNGNRTSNSVQNWDGTVWVNSSHDTLIYDANGNWISQFSQTWDGTAWVNSNQINFIYDVNGNQISELQQYWGDTSWVKVRTYTYTYDSYGNQINSLYKYWNEAGIVTSGDSCNYYYSQVGSGSCSAYFSLNADTIPHNYYAVNMASGTPPLTYWWSWGDGSFDSIAYPNHTYDTAGFYTICLTITDSTGCTETYCDSFNLFKMMLSMIYVNVIPETSVGIQSDHNKETPLTIFPNPALDYLTINLHETMAEIKIFNLIGGLISTTSVNSQQTSINISNLNFGIYIIEISVRNKVFRKKFVKGNL